MYAAIKHIHMLCALLSISGFVLRGLWMLIDSPILQKKLVKILPHIIDTVLLLSALALAILSSQYPFVHSWLTAKLFLLLLYIGLGLVALRFGKTKGQKGIAFVSAVASFVLIALIAFNKDIMLGL